MHIRVYLAALQLVNEERRRAGLPELDHLPEGIAGDPRRCAIAKAIPGAHVDHVLRTDSGARPLPPDVLRFISAFDRRRGRGLVDPGSLVQGGIEDDKGCLVSV